MAEITGEIKMTLYQNALYMEDVHRVASLDLPWDELRGKSVLMSGATGLIGSFLTDVLMEKNLNDALGCSIYALCRNEKRARSRFSKYCGNDHLIFINYDFNEPFISGDIKNADYVLHLASNTHPMQYSTDPIGTITTNIIGVRNMLELASDNNAVRFLFASSNEIYGENRGDVEFFNEDYCGYINSNTMRAGYPESKRCGEALCQAYKAQKGLDIVIPRITRSYGPTMLMSDTKAVSQFIRHGIAEENIVLKSSGTQYYSYAYVSDSVSGLLTILLKGKNGEAYNIAEEHSDIMLKDLAEIIAGISGKKVVFEASNAVESAGYSTATKARLDGQKLSGLGWQPQYDIRSGIIRTMKILKELN